MAGGKADLGGRHQGGTDERRGPRKPSLLGNPCWEGWRSVLSSRGDSYKAHGLSVHGGVMRGVWCLERFGGAQSTSWGISSRKLGDRSPP